MTNKILKNMLLTLGATSLLVVPSIVMASCSTGGSDTKPPVDPGGDGGGTKPPIDPPIKKPPLNLVNKTTTEKFLGSVPNFDFSLGNYTDSDYNSENGLIQNFDENLIYNLQASIEIDAYELYYNSPNPIVGSNGHYKVPAFKADINFDFSFKLEEKIASNGLTFYDIVITLKNSNDGNQYNFVAGDSLQPFGSSRLEDGLLSQPLDPSFVVNPAESSDSDVYPGQKNFQIGFGENNGLSLIVSPVVYVNDETMILKTNYPENKDKKMSMTYSITPKI